jgi:predicted RNA-binding Zn-ribbon protein involved in translation (DUF1610 family)
MTDVETKTMGTCPTCKTVLRRYVQTDGDVIGHVSELPSTADLSICTACGEAVIVRDGVRLASSRDLEFKNQIVEVLRITLAKLRAKAGRPQQ